MSDYDKVPRKDYEIVIKQRNDLMHQVDNLEARLHTARLAVDLVNLIKEIVGE